MNEEKYMDTTENEQWEDNLHRMDHRQLVDQYVQMKEIATRDGMTGLLNRRAMEQQINLRLQAMQETDSCALFIIDLDNFKTVNDSLGHQSGDQVITRAGRILAGMFRATDIVGRLGGDEFVVFLAGKIDEALVKKKGEQICDQIQLVMGRGSGLFVTASVGIHLARGTGQSFEYLYRSADLALYKAKKNGGQSYCLKMNTEDQEAMEQERHTPVNAIRLKSLLDYIDSGVAMLEMKHPTTFIYASPSFAHMLGMKEADLAEMPALQLVHPDDVQELERLLRKNVLEKNETLSHVLRVFTKDGVLMWWRIHAVHIEYSEQRPVILVTAIDISEMKERESHLQKSNDLFQIALDQTMQGIWEVELRTRTFRLMGEQKNAQYEMMKPVDFPEGLIRSRWVSPESAEEFREFGAEVFSGRSQGYGNFLVRYKDTEKYRWTSFSYRMVFDDAGRPVRVVGIMEGLDQETEEETGTNSSQKTKLPESMLSSLVLQMHANLTQDTVRYFWIEGKDMTKAPGCQTAEAVLQEEKKRLYSVENIRRFPAYFSREGLRQICMEKGESWTTYEYDRVDGGGHVFPAFSVVHLYREKKSGDVQLDVWLSRCEQRRRWENEYMIGISKDPATKTYSCANVRDMAVRMMKEKEHRPCALVLVEVGGLDFYYGREPGEKQKKWKAILTVLTLATGLACLPGECGKDCAIFFFPEVKSKESVHRKLEQALLFTRSLLAEQIDEKKVRFLVSMVCRYSDETDYSEMLRKAQELCDSWRNTASDHIVCADDVEEECWEQLRKESEEDRIRIPQEEISRPFSDREKEAAFNCVLGMMEAESLEESAKCVLGTLGNYYDADRTYILVPAEYGHVVTMPHEWTSQRKGSLQQVVSGMTIDNFPLLARCEKEGKPIFLTRQKPLNTTGMVGGQKEEAWHFAVFPMREDGTVQGYLCIENAGNHIFDAAFTDLLASCLLKERRKYLRNSRRLSGEYSISSIDIPNLSSYMESIYSFNSDVYSTLGAVSVDVPALSALNGSLGFEFGRKMLWYIAQTMTDIFGRAMLFRTWDAEFVALCPNTTRQVFQGKCARLRTALTRRYPKEVRIGMTWADKIFSGKALVDEAKSLMRCDNTTQMQLSVEQMKLPPAFAIYTSVGEMVNAGKFTVFLQPKVNMKTGKIVGAEALVRGLDDAGNVIPPVQFIEEIEKGGTIRDLDLFVLDRTMNLLNQWRKRGYRLLPVSVNFSRVTLFDTNALASVLAIQSRYPKIDPSLIEIEITESAGNVSQDTLMSVMEKFREFGVRFSLDDFGSRYSNLAIFTNVRFDTVKLDRSIVSEIVRNEKGQMLVREIVQICEKSGMQCIAEGVEHLEQAVILMQVGCCLAQGFYYDRPLPAEQFSQKYLDGRQA